MWPNSVTIILNLVGTPLDMPKIEEPDQETIDKYHSLYMEKLCQLFNENVDKYGDPSKSLSIE